MTLRELGEWLLGWEEDHDKEVCFLDPLPYDAKYTDLTIQADPARRGRVVITNLCEKTNENQVDMFT